MNEQIYVLGRDQITRLHDLNGDGEADFYENFNNDCMVSEHFHEFALDLKTGPRRQLLLHQVRLSRAPGVASAPRHVAASCRRTARGSRSSRAASGP